LVTKTSSVYTYEYHLKGHLGNTRVAFQPNGSGTTTTQVAEYYPFGSSYLPVSPAGTNKYLYNGKEKQDDVLSSTALDWYDYGARFYDPQIGRWHCVDPLAEKYNRISPYAYCINNPVLLIDPNGMEWFYYSVDGKKDATWNWRDESQYHTGVKDDKGKEVVLQGQEAVVTFDGAKDEKLGKDQNLFGDGAKLADVTAYGPRGKDDIQHYKGFTMTSDSKAFGAIADGEYTVNYREPGKNGKLKSHWAVNNTEAIDCLDGINPSPIDPYSSTQKNGVYVHTSNQSGFAGKIYDKNGNLVNAITTGCLLIVPSGHGTNGWNEFNEQLQGITSFHLILNRK